MLKKLLAVILLAIVYFKVTLAYPIILNTSFILFNLLDSFLIIFIIILKVKKYLKDQFGID
jgi:uncharacterized membrane protein